MSAQPGHPYTGVPSAEQEGPTPCLDSLGIILDTIRMDTRIYHTVANWLDKRIVGLFEHATKGDLWAECTALLQDGLPLNKDFRSDLYCWHTCVIKVCGLHEIGDPGSPSS